VLSIGTFWAQFLLSVLSGAVGITIAIYYKDIDKSVASGMIPIYIYLLWNFIDVFITIKAENTFLAFLIIAPFCFILPLAAVEWWRSMQ
jgi:hypothetical protein